MIRLDDHFIVPSEGSGDVGYALANLLDLRWSCYRKALKRCRRKFSEKSVHGVRVEIRRMLSTLGLLEALLERETIEPLFQGLKDQLKALSRLRDTHVQIEAVDKMLARKPDLEPFKKWLQRKERRLAKRVERHLEQTHTAKATRLVGQLACTLRQAEQENTTRDTKAVLVRATGRAFDAVIARCRHVSSANIDAIHRTRVAFKKFRYMVEALAKVLPGIPERQLRAMQAFQTRMGKIQDVETLLKRSEKYASCSSQDDLESFRRQLLRRRVRLARDFVAQADRLLDFWPPYSFHRYEKKSIRATGRRGA